MRRIPAGVWIAAVLVAIPLALSFVPGLPPHGYGYLLLVFPVVQALRYADRRPRLLLYGAGIVLQFLAYPDPDLGFLGWVLLWPYLLARERDDSARWFPSAFLYGFLRAFAGFYWLGNVHFTAWLGVSIAAAFAFAVAFEWPVRRLTFVPYPLRVAAAWLLFEWVHTWFLGGFPWLFLSHTQYRFLALVQMADVVGAFGVSFLVAYVQAAALEAIRVRRFTASAGTAAALLGAALLYGTMRGGPGGPEGPGVLMVQSAVPSYVKEEKLAQSQGVDDLWRTLLRLTDEGLNLHPDTRLVIWPETMFPRAYLESDPSRGDFSARAHQFARRFKTPAVFGLTSYRDLDQYKLGRGYNAAILVDAEGRVKDPSRDVYRKQRLVPMGEEFTPRRFLPDAWGDAWFGWLSRNLGLPRSCDLESGEGFRTLDAGPGLRCAPLICFEGLYPDLVRGAVEEGHPDLVLHLVNNGWFVSPPFLWWHVPSFEQRQCLPSWVFRAVETRTPFLSCANAGVTCAVAPTGEIVGRVDRVMEEGVLHVRVPARWERPLCLRGGFLLPPVLLLLLLPVFLWRARRKAREPGDSGPSGQGS